MKPMLRSIQLRMAGVLSHLASADQISALSKYVFLRQLLKDLGIVEVLDVGANAGQFATALRRIGFRGAIISFEPIPEVFDAIRTKMARDANWSGHNLAVGDNEAVLELNVMASSVYSSFNSPVDSQDGRNRIVRTCRVPVIRLDRFLDQRDLGRTLLKVDTQGYEIQVFRGLGDRLATLRAVMCEVSVNALYDATPSMNQIVNFLSERAFKPAFFSPVGGRADDLSAREFDYICTRQQSSV
jgi:FkbM family methyltransferase